MSNSSEWDKYAKNDSNSLIKVAKSETTNVSDEVLKTEIQEKIASGLQISDAVPMTVAERMFSIPWKLAQVSNEVVEIAREVSETDPAISEKLYDFADQIRQESLHNYRDCLLS
jgi:cysteinyl-tRNA synthetase